ncbi:EAL domain-containing protein [Vibrio makurazakiensis]|uniref:EAL domain-containing protein n=1 Tax=Vibrio makurazakiensis TaxID=2910250 RepID=UPI003D0F074B
MEINQLESQPVVDRRFDFSGSHYPIVDWTLNLENQKLEYDVSLINELLNLTSPLQKYSDVLKLVTKQCRRQLKQKIEEVLDTGEPRFVTCCVFPNGQIFSYVEIYIEMLSPSVLQGTLRPMFSISSKSEVANIFGAMFENSHHGIIITDEQTRIIACNSYYEQQSGYENSALVGLKTSILNAGKHSPQFYKNMWRALRDEGMWSGVMLAKNSKGFIYPQEMTIQKVEPTEGKVYYVGLTVNLSRSLAQIADKELGGVELLTQLPTKERFLSQLDILLESKDQTTGVIVLGIKPEFDADSLFEDQKQFADILSHIRGTRVPGYVGSYTFVVCVEFVIPEKGTFVHALNNAIRRYFTELKNIISERVYLAIFKGKVGASILDVDAKNSHRLLSHSLQAMVGAKEYAGKHINYFHSNTHKEMARKQYLEVVIQQLLNRSLLEVHYQPIVDAQTGKVMMFECLCRFPTIKGEVFDTQEMIDLTEELGLITELDRSVALIALKEHKKIRQLFGDETGLTINCSLKTNGNAQRLLVETAQLISSHTDRPDLVIIEITENGHFASDFDQERAFEKLGELGLSVAIDDFGSGYSSLSYLSNGYFKRLKIDRGLIVDIHENTNKFNIIKMITKLSHTLGIKVIAEGIEKPEELTILQLLNVDYIQGYLIDKPSKLTELPQLLEKEQDESMFNPRAKPQDVSQTIYAFFRHAPPKVKSNDPLSLAASYLENKATHYLPVIVEKKCVGLLNKEIVNLHMTPAMGTDLESEKEAKIWNKPVNQMMKVTFTSLPVDTHMNEIPGLVEKGVAFPWVLINEQGHYKGMVNESDLLAYCLPWMD